MKTTSKVVKIKTFLFPSNVNNSCFNLGAIMFHLSLKRITSAGTTDIWCADLSNPG